MGFFSRKKRQNKTDDDAILIDELTKVKKALKIEGKEGEMAAGYGVNMAHSMFNQKYPNIESFLKLNRKSQLGYIAKIADMVNKLYDVDAFVALGYRLFQLWLSSLAFHLDRPEGLIRNEMDRLSRLGDIA